MYRYRYIGTSYTPMLVPPYPPPYTSPLTNLRCLLTTFSIFRPLYFSLEFFRPRKIEKVVGQKPKISFGSVSDPRWGTQKVGWTREGWPFGGASGGLEGGYGAEISCGTEKAAQSRY